MLVLLEVYRLKIFLIIAPAEGPATRMLDIAPVPLAVVTQARVLLFVVGSLWFVVSIVICPEAGSFGRQGDYLEFFSSLVSSANSVWSSRCFL